MAARSRSTSATSQYFQAGLFIEHVPWGLLVLGNYGDLSVDGVDTNSQTWYVKAGIRQRWHPLGHTVLYGEYQQNDDGGVLNFAPATTCVDPTVCTGPTASESHWWGAGVVQEIDAAAMSIWLRWRQTSYDDNSFDNGVAITYDDLQEITFGGLINF